MKNLNLITLYKAELKKNMMAQIKGGGDVKCLCTISNNPQVNTREAGGSISGLCICKDSIASSSSVQNKPSPH